MHVISRKALREFWKEHADAEEPLKRWLSIANRADWSGFAALRRDFATADLVGHLVVINIGGNKYRLVLEVFFQDQVVLVRNVLTHEEYDKGAWRIQRPAAARRKARHGDENREETGAGEGERKSARGSRE